MTLYELSRDVLDAVAYVFNIKAFIDLLLKASSLSHQAKMSHGGFKVTELTADKLDRVQRNPTFGKVLYIYVYIYIYKHKH